MGKVGKYLVAVVPLVVSICFVILNQNLITWRCVDHVFYTGNGITTSFSMPLECRFIYGLAPYISLFPIAAFIWLPYGLTWANQKLAWTKYVVLGIAILLFVGSIMIGFGGRCPHGCSRDARRISDIRQIQAGLDLYRGANNKYPAKLDDLGGVSGIKYIPQDPMTQKAYDYAPSADQQHYVLRAVLEDASNPALKSGVTGIVNGLDCTPPAYCVAL